MVLACIGIGENGHIAFNDPPPGGADFNDAKLVKLVELDEAVEFEAGESYALRWRIGCRLRRLRLLHFALGTTIELSGGRQDLGHPPALQGLGPRTDLHLFDHARLPVLGFRDGVDIHRATTPAAVPVSKSSDDTVPMKASSMCTWASTAPGRT